MDAKGYVKKALWIALPAAGAFVIYMVATHASGCVERIDFDGDKKLAEMTINDLMWVLIIFSVLWSALRSSK